MKPDARLRAALDSSWNEMREQRVLGRVVEARRQRLRRGRGLAAAAVVTACAIVAVVVTLRVATRPTSAVAVRATETPLGGPASRITLADGSEAVLAPDGDVHIEEQSPTTVHLRQRAGGVRYVVQPNPSREFAVFAEGIAVRVRGTIFSVSVHAEAVEIGVERGRVEVDDGSRKRDLVAGEALSVPLHRTDVVAPDGAAAASPAGSAVVQTPSTAIAPTGAPAVSSTVPPASALLARADAARSSGRPAEAAQALEAFVTTYPRERRVPAALFTLGRVERARGRYEAAASAFERCTEAMPGGPLADDALAEAAQSWDAARDADRARADARADLAAHPGGLHATAMRALIAK